MIILQVNGLTKSFSGSDLLVDIQLEIQHRDRVALVGRNGAGKSTLLKLIAGEMSADHGDIIIPKDIRIGYLAQHTGLDSERTVWDEMLTVFEPLRTLEQQLRSLELEMANPNVYEVPSEYERVMKTYDTLQLKFKDSGGYQYESDCRSVLHGMQFYEEDYDKPVQLLSGGEKTRLALAKMLLSKPDLLILDEPTNHLDIATLSWLEKYLNNYEGAILIVSHDRYFLDQIVTTVYEVSRKKLTKYVGNYSQYIDEKAKNYERDRKQYEREMSERAKLEDFIQRNIARASTSKMAKSRRKMLERTEWMDAPEGNERSARFSFTIERQSGNDVLSLEDVAIGYGETPLAEQIHFRVYKQERIALIGPNGIGKSTLLKTIIKQQEPLKGHIQYGTNVQLGYYDQNQATLLGNRNVLHEVWDDWPLLSEKEVRSLLGRFLFSGEDVEKPVSTLSGGEKARLSLAKLMLQKANTLVLDEPTNHLDLDSKEVLENALDDFPGTILFVSHDRYFINRLATKVIEIGPTGITEYLGDYDYYLEKKEELLEQLQNNEQPVQRQKERQQVENKEQQKQIRRLRRAIEETEQQMLKLEESIDQLQEKLHLPEHANDHLFLMDIQSQIDAYQLSYDELADQWLHLQEQLETIHSI